MRHDIPNSHDFRHYMIDSTIVTAMIKFDKSEGVLLKDSDFTKFYGIWDCDRIKSGITKISLKEIICLPTFSERMRIS